MLVLTFVENTTSVRTSFLLSAIFKEMWAISPSEIIANKAIIHGLMNQHGFEESKQPFAIGLIGAIDNHLSIMPMAANGNSSTKIPTGSIAIVPLKGTMMKEDTYCSYGTLTIANIIRDLGSNADVAGVIVEGDTGGGAVNAVPPLADAITFARKSKPVVCLADTLASAGMWSMSFCDEIWASNTISSCFGSIGVMYSYQFWITEFLKENGIEQGNVYPDESNFKNLPFEELLKGNTEPLKTKVLSPLAQKFQADIKKNIPGIDLSVEGIINGDMFFAKDALKHGMIQGIGTMDDVIARVRKLAKTGTTGSSAQSTINKNNNVSPKPNAQMKYATLCTLLGLAGLEFGKDGKASFTKEEIASIQGAYKMKFKAALDIKGVEYDAEGNTSLTEAEVQTIEDALNAEVPTTVKPAATTPPANTEEKADDAITAVINASFKRIEDSMEARFAAMEENITQKPASTSGTRVITIGANDAQKHKNENMKYVFGAAHQFNSADSTRPWNMMALGMSASAIDLNVSQLNTDLGEYIKVNASELQNLLVGDQLEAIFPTLSGYTGKSATLGVFVDEVIQPYQKAWTPKGGIKIQPELLKMFDIKIDLELEDLKTTLKGWLSEFNKEGSQAYKLSFVGYILKLILMKARQDDNIATIKGVYKEPIAGQPGRAINTRDGLYQLVRKAITQNKVKPFAIGEWNPSNIIEWQTKFILSIPETIRDRANLALYVPKIYIETYWTAKRLIEGSYPDYDPSKTTIPGFDNIRLIAVPYAGDTKRVICTYVGNIVQVMNIVEEKGIIKLEESKRVIIAFGDYEASITIGFVGKKENSQADISFENQAIFVNDADEPETHYVTVDADKTVLSVSVHTSLVTSANTQATVITDIEDRKTGQKIRVKCGSTTNASKINTGGNFVLDSNWAPTNVGDELVLIVRSDLKMAEYQRLSAATSAAELESSATPSLGNFANGTSFVTNDANSGAVAITDFANATVGVEFTVYSSNPGTNKTSIANSGKFVLTAAWADAANAYLKLMKRPDGKFIETARG